MCRQCRPPVLTGIDVKNTYRKEKGLPFIGSKHRLYGQHHS
jgi:hypothetical protein